MSSSTVPSLGGDKTFEATLSNHNSDLYQKNASFVYSAAFTSPVLTLLDAQPGQRILDMGCGTGELTAQIQQAVGSEGEVWGVDSNSEMLAKASKTYSSLSSNLFQSDIQSLVLPSSPSLENSFDSVFTSATLHWCRRDPAGVIEGVKKCLKPGGKFVGEMGGFLNVIGVRTHLHQILSSPPYSLDASELDPWFFPTASNYSSLLTAALFRIRSIELVPRYTDLPQGLFAWLETFARNSFLSGLSDEDAVAVMKECERRCAPDCQDEKGQWAVMYMRLRWEAVLE
ncbi:S-adenosyl-L-methionine-dependent methyltransferase [Mrakia frigida]|uniref:class I SAM-dependent methyltransferase n=1 Tax=Mrakia frigida TaxID=29902 RepID=UPI003FCBFE40